jgi:hypothetical protein
MEMEQQQKTKNKRDFEDENENEESKSFHDSCDDDDDDDDEDSDDSENSSSDSDNNSDSGGSIENDEETKLIPPSSKDWNATEKSNQKQLNQQKQKQKGKQKQWYKESSSKSLVKKRGKKGERKGEKLIAPRRNCCHSFFILVQIAAILANLCMIAIEVVPVVYVLRGKKPATLQILDIALRCYFSFFSTFFLVTELEWIDSSLNNWITRGFLYTFLGECIICVPILCVLRRIFLSSYLE